ncbi:MAG TPA: DUF4189 domain-containing protein [Solirubrobacterales bacterium]
MSRRALSILCALIVTGALAAPAAAQASWGSIAIDPTTGKIGYSRGEPTAAKAKLHARNECGTNHCKSALWVFNGYGAVVQKKNGIYISGIGTSKSRAFRNARNRANDSSARSVAWVFSGLS